MKEEKTGQYDASRALAAKISEERLRLGVTLQTIGKSTGVDVSQVSRLCRGDFVRLSSNLRNICKYLQIAPEKYFQTSLLPERVARRAGAIWHRSPNTVARCGRYWTL